MFDEIMGHRLALAYTSTGGGFSHQCAGISHPGVEKVPKEYWAPVQRKAFDDDFKTNMKSEIRKIEARTRLYKALYEGLAESEILDGELEIELEALRKAIDAQKEVERVQIAESKDEYGDLEEALDFLLNLGEVDESVLHS